MSMINYIRNLKRLLQMENKEHNINLEELVLAINDKINHIEDAMIDHRELLIKLVKQNNEVVKVLKSIEIEEVSDDEDITDMMKNDMPKPEGKFKHIRELIDEFMDRHQSLKEFEEELEKVKKLITPGQVGEA